MILRSFIFCFNTSYRYLILECRFGHLDNLSGKNMIPDLLSSAILILKVSFRQVIAVYHRAQLVHFSTLNIILSTKTLPFSI